MLLSKLYDTIVIKVIYFTLKSVKLFIVKKNAFENAVLCILYSVFNTIMSKSLKYPQIILFYGPFDKNVNIYKQSYINSKEIVLFYNLILYIYIVYV